MVTIVKLKSGFDNHTPSRFKRINWVSASAILFIILIFLSVISFALGRYPVSPLDVLKVLISQVLPIDHTWSGTVETVVLQIRLPRILEAMGISHLRDKPYTQISGGERQLVMFARVLAQKPSLLLLDEPTSHLDFGNQTRLLRIVQRLSATGLPIIMTSHFPDHAFLVSNKVALMQKGKFIDIGTPEKIITDSNLEKVYDIKVKVIEVNSGINRKICVPVEDCSPTTVSNNIINLGGYMQDFEFYMKKAGDYHGHICAGIALGTRITLAAMKFLGLDPGVKNKSLIVYAEIDRCMTDAVQVITGCTLGHRSLKHIDYGKFAATFVNLNTGKAVRATVKEQFSNEGNIEETIKKIARTPDNELVTLQEVSINIPETDLPGPPKGKAVCASCGERVMDGREVKQGDKTLCRGCAKGKYYKEIN